MVKHIDDRPNETVLNPILSKFVRILEYTYPVEKEIEFEFSIIVI